jgi:hypothetical protein
VDNRIPNFSFVLFATFVVKIVFSFLVAAQPRWARPGIYSLIMTRIILNFVRALTAWG